MLIDLFFFVLIAMMSIPLVGGYYASSRGRSFWRWYWISFFFPVISFIVLLFLPDANEGNVDELNELRIQHGMLGLKAEYPAQQREMGKMLKNPKRSIHFVLSEQGKDAHKVVDIYVDGKRLCEWAQQVEAAQAIRDKNPLLAGNYEGLPAELLKNTDHLMGKPHLFYTDKKGRTQLLVCGQTGSPEQGGLLAKVEVLRKWVIWYNFRASGQPHWEYSSLPPLVFDRLAYEEALAEITELCLAAK